MVSTTTTLCFCLHIIRKQNSMLDGLNGTENFFAYFSDDVILPRLMHKHVLYLSLLSSFSRNAYERRQ